MSMLRHDPLEEILRPKQAIDVIEKQAHCVYLPQASQGDVNNPSHTKRPVDWFWGANKDVRPVGAVNNFCNQRTRHFIGTNESISIVDDYKESSSTVPFQLLKSGYNH